MKSKIWTAIGILIIALLILGRSWVGSALYAAGQSIHERLTPKNEKIAQMIEQNRTRFQENMNEARLKAKQNFDINSKNFERKIIKRDNLGVWIMAICNDYMDKDNLDRFIIHEFEYCWADRVAPMGDSTVQTTVTGLDRQILAVYEDFAKDARLDALDRMQSQKFFSQFLDDLRTSKTFPHRDDFLKTSRQLRDFLVQKRVAMLADGTGQRYLLYRRAHDLVNQAEGEFNSRNHKMSTDDEANWYVLTKKDLDILYGLDAFKKFGVKIELEPGAVEKLTATQRAIYEYLRAAFQGKNPWLFEERDGQSTNTPFWRRYWAYQKDGIPAAEIKCRDAMIQAILDAIKKPQ